MSVDDAVTLGERLEQLGIVAIVIIAIIALGYATFRTRQSTEKDEEGNPVQKSSLLVAGWVHDAQDHRHRREMKAQREFYAKALADEQERANVRIAEWRAFRDEAVAKAADADEDRRRLLEAVTSSSRDIGLILELQRMADRDGRESRPTRAK